MGKNKEAAVEQNLKIASAAELNLTKKPAVGSGSGKKTAAKSAVIKNDPVFLFEQYKVLSDRRIHHNSMLWGMPALFISAQSVLIGLTFNAGSDWIRIITSFFALFIGILLIQTYERNRIMEVSDSVQLNDIEEHFLPTDYYSMKVHHRLENRYFIDNERRIIDYLEDNGYTSFFNRFPSYVLWRSGMYMITIASLLIFLYYTLSQIPYVKDLTANLNMQVIIFLIAAMLLNWLLFTFHYIAMSRNIAESKKSTSPQDIAEFQCKKIGQKYRTALWCILAAEITIVLAGVYFAGVLDEMRLINTAVSIFVLSLSFIVYRLIIRKKKSTEKADLTAGPAASGRLQKPVRA